MADAKGTKGKGGKQTMTPDQIKQALGDLDVREAEVKARLATITARRARLERSAAKLEGEKGAK